MQIPVPQQKMLDIKHIAQDEPHTCALVALKMGLAFRGKPVKIERLKDTYCKVYNILSAERKVTVPVNITSFPVVKRIAT